MPENNQQPGGNNTNLPAQEGGAAADNTSKGVGDLAVDKEEIAPLPQSKKISETADKVGDNIKPGQGIPASSKKEISFETLDVELKLKEQYRKQIEILTAAGIITSLPFTKKQGIYSIDGNEYPLPAYEEIEKKVREKTRDIYIKMGQGFTKLLIVPLGMNLEELIEKYKKVILKHYQDGKLLAGKVNPDDPDVKLEINQEEIVWVWKKFRQADINGTIVYYPDRFLIEHGGQTKRKLISEKNLAWHTILVENLINIPREGAGNKIEERPQLEANRTPEEYLNIIQSGKFYELEQGLSPEDLIMYAVTALEETNQVIDDYQGSGSICYHIGAYFPATSNFSFLPVSDYVPGSGWGRDKNQVSLDGFEINYRRGDCGTRTGVRI